jgi:hypothetical protein
MSAVIDIRKIEPFIIELSIFDPNHPFVTISYHHYIIIIIDVYIIITFIY